VKYTTTNSMTRGGSAFRPVWNDILLDKVRYDEVLRDVIGNIPFDI